MKHADVSWPRLKYLNFVGSVHLRYSRRFKFDSIYAALGLGFFPSENHASQPDASHRVHVESTERSMQLIMSRPLRTEHPPSAELKPEGCLTLSFLPVNRSPLTHTSEKTNTLIGIN